MEALRLPAGSLAGLRKFVSNGGSLLVLAGPHGLGSGSYNGTPLAELLPIHISSTDTWRKNQRHPSSCDPRWDRW